MKWVKGKTGYFLPFTLPLLFSDKRKKIVKLGVVFPQWAIKSDPIAFKDFAQAVEGMGYDYILLYEAIVDTKKPAGWHEPFTFISYLAGVTSKLEFATGIVVLPSRQTVF